MYLITDTGCYADGALGHSHARYRLVDLLKGLYRHHPRGGDGIHWPEIESIVTALQAEMSDDVSEEDEAIEWLNKMCEEGCSFQFVDGDLVLIEDSETE